jgi:hypothetical protein
VWAGLALLQLWYIHLHLMRTTHLDLESYAKDIATEIAYTNGWNPSGCRRASIVAPAWFVVTSVGTIIDVEGFVPGLLGRAANSDESIFASRKTVETEAGEKRRLFGKKLLGGEVLVGGRCPLKSSTPTKG